MVDMKDSHAHTTLSTKASSLSVLENEINNDQQQGCDLVVEVDGVSKGSSELSVGANDIVDKHAHACNGTSSAEAIDFSDESLFSLHKAVYNNDVKTVSKCLRSSGTDIARKDRQGNTALHIATMLGHKECIQLLLAHDAPVNCKNLSSQTPLNEAISFGDRKIIVTMLRRLRQQTQVSLEEHQPDVKKALTDLGDFYLELKWEFHSWVPLVSRFLPSDVCKLYKCGCQIRMDTTLVDFKDMKWERGDLTFLFDGEKLSPDSLLVMDNNAKVYQQIRDQSEQIVEDDVDILMSSDNETGKMSTRDITFTRAHTGIIFKAEKTETIGGCQANFYNMHGVKVVSTKRREHLSEEDIKKNKSKMDTSNIHKTLTEGPNIPKRESLPLPPANTVPWDEYFSAPAGEAPCIGRPIKSKSNSRTFQASVAMSEDFPVSVDQLVTVIESIKPLRHFRKLREFLTTKLPPGFPVKLEIPVFPTVAANVMFERFEWRDDLPHHMFKVPRDYEEDAQRFAGL